MRLTLTVFVLTAFLLGTPAAALERDRELHQYSIDVWKADHGLPQNSVEAILQTRDGYLWIGTQEGLVRFDGVRFAVFDKRNTPVFASNHVQRLIEDRTGALWIGTFSGGLVRYRDGVFKRFGAADGLPDESASAIAEDQEGALWVAGNARGLARIVNGKVTAQSVDAPGGRVTTIAVDDRGRIWMGTRAGLVCLDRGRSRTITREDGLPDNEISSIFTAPNGVVWIGTSSGLARVDDQGIRVWTVREGVPDGRIRAVYQDRRGSLWVGTSKGLSRLRDDRFETLQKKDGLGSDVVNAIYEDREGSLWVGIATGGLTRLRAGSMLTFSTPHGLAEPVAYCVTGDATGDLWVGSDAGNVSRLSNGRFELVIPAREIDGTQVRALRWGRDGNLWIGTDRGLYRWSNRRVFSYRGVAGMPAEAVRALYEDREGRVWIGTDGGGVTVLKDRTFVTYTVRNGLPSNQIRAIHQNRDGSIWIGSYGGLTRVVNGQFTHFGKRDGLTHPFVRTIHEDSTGTMWIGSYGGGLFRYAGGVFTAFTEHQGLFSDVIYQILGDDAGNLWMTCNKGIFRVSVKELDEVARGARKTISPVSYAETDGMRNRECNGGNPGGWMTPQGRLWFATVDGVVMTDPKAQQHSNPLAPQLAIETVHADAGAFDIRKPVVLRAGTRRVEIQYAGLSFLSPLGTAYAIRLDGFDQDWVNVGGRRTAHYTNLAPGSYTFHVKARNSDGVWNTTGASLSFTLEPYFYQTRTFTVVGWIAGIGLVIAAYRLRVAQLRRRQRHLQEKIDEAVAQIKVLSGMMPICAWCKKIRDDQGYWSQIEAYIRDHTDAQFSHSICPECLDGMSHDAALAHSHEPPAA